jgi:hypothetical protein
VDFGFDPSETVLYQQSIVTLYLTSHFTAGNGGKKQNQMYLLSA